MIGCGIFIEVASDRNGGVAFLSFSGRHLGNTVPGQIGLAAGIPWRLKPREPLGDTNRLRAEQPRWANVAAEPVADHHALGGRAFGAELETDCYSNIGTRNVRFYRLNTFCLIKSGDGGLLDLIETDLIAPAIVELRRARRGRLGPMNKKGLLAVSVGAFADPAFPSPSQAVYAEHRGLGTRPIETASYMARCRFHDFM
jgi:hypothetical protein